MKKVLIVLLVFSLIITGYASDIGKWKVEVKEDALFGSTSIFINLVDSEIKKGLSIRTKDNEVDVVIVWDDYLGSKNLAVLYKFDDGEVQTENWVISTNGKAVFLPSSIWDENYNFIDRPPQEFIKQLMNADRLVVGLTPYREARQVAIFDVQGLANAIEPYKKEFGLE